MKGEEGNLLAFPQHLVVCHNFAYANPESHCEPVCACVCVCPKGVLGALGCLGCSSPVVVAQSFRKFNLFPSRSRQHCSQFSIFQFYFQFYFSAFVFPFSFIFILLFFCVCFAEGQLQIFAICYSCCRVLCLYAKRV